MLVEMMGGPDDGRTYDLADGAEFLVVPVIDPQAMLQLAEKFPEATIEILTLPICFNPLYKVKYHVHYPYDFFNQRGGSDSA